MGYLQARPVHACWVTLTVELQQLLREASKAWYPADLHL